MQIKIIMAYLLNLLGSLLPKKQTKHSIGKDVKKLEPVGSAGRIVKWCNHYGKQKN